MGGFIFHLRVFLTANKMNRFRWAVCQLDVLQRLKGERHIVQNALKDLPKTLDETYDRLLLTLPEEDHQFVHHTIQLILYHSKLYGGSKVDGGIPCAVLIKGVERSLAGLNSNHNDRFYNHETLRELCGCLINVTQEYSEFDNVLAGNYSEMETRPKHEVLTVSFAHYTVHEYLNSNRTSKTSTAYVTSCKEDLEQTYLQMMFAESLQLGPGGRWDYSAAPRYHCDVLEALEGYFLNYCMVSALYSLRRWSARISRHDTLSKLAIVLLDPSKAHIHFLESAARHLDDLLTPPWIENLHFWNVIWDSRPSNTDAAHLLHILLLAWEKPECLPLAENFLQSKNNKNFLTARLTFRMSESIYRFDGSIIEIFAQAAFQASHIFGLLLEHGTGLFDPSAILLRSIGCHQDHPKHDCSSYCLLERLLELGADPNMTGCWVTPLQIAVKCYDLKAVTSLLEAGANPNPIEQSNGIAWKHGTHMSRYNYLHGVSPLYIFRRYTHTGLVRETRMDSKRIEAILLQYKAEEYRIA